jgi:hypothetical protein
MNSPKAINSQDILEWIHEKQLAALLQDAKTQLDQEQQTAAIETETDRLIQDTCQSLKAVTLDDEIQQEVARILYKLPDLRKLQNGYLVRMAKNAIDLLLASATAPADTPASALPLRRRNLTIARRIRRRIRYEIFVNNSQSTMLILGLAGFISIFAIAPFLVYLLIQGVAAPSLQVRSSDGQITIKPDRTLVLQLPGQDQRLEANSVYVLMPVGSKGGSATAPDAAPRPGTRSEPSPAPVDEASPEGDDNGGPPLAMTPPPLESLVPEPMALEDGGDRPNGDPSPESRPATEPEAGERSEEPAPEAGVIAVGDGTLRNTGTFFDNVGIRLSLLLVVVIGGALGSSVSVIIRAQNMVYGHRPEPLVLFFTGLLKPIIGIAFAIFIFAALESGLISVGSREQTNRTYLYLAISFVAGFSERFVQDILMKTEQAVTPMAREDSGKPLP